MWLRTSRPLGLRISRSWGYAPLAALRLRTSRSLALRTSRPLGVTAASGRANLAPSLPSDTRAMVRYYY